MVPIGMFALGAMLAAAGGGDPGVPWTGAPGITEGVDVIMAREGLHAAMGPSCIEFPDSVREASEALLGRRQRPDSPAVSRWPEDARSRSDPETLAPQSVGLSFLGGSSSDGPVLPPDTMGAVGPTQILVVTNNRIKVFSKTGVVGPLDASLQVFFASVSDGFFVGDPQARYDRLSGRFFLTAITFPDPNRVLIAVSSGSAITGASSFSFFWFRQDMVSPQGDSGLSADYDSLGVDRHALYIGAHIASFKTGELFGEAGFVVRKSDLLAGTLTVTAFRDLGKLGVGMAAPRGVNNDDPDSSSGFFVGTDGANLGQVDLYRIEDPGGVPSISPLIAIGVPTTSEAIPQVVRGSPPEAPLATVPLLLAAEIRLDRITGRRSLWTAQTMEVDEEGVAVAGGGRNGTRWYEIGDLEGTPALVQAGTLHDPSQTAPRGYWMATVTSTGQGHMALGASFAGPDHFAGVAVAGRLRGDPPGLTQAPTAAWTAITAYNRQLGEQLWGDYSQTVVDPVDDQTVWTFQEYCAATNTWGVRVVQLRAPPPATPSSLSPDAVCTGSASTLVTVTGTSIAGSEFFDPGPDPGGPGFPRRIAASVLSVGVNGVTFLDPTHVRLDLSTTSTPPGATSVTVTNPDLQARTGVGLLTVLAEGAACTDLDPTTCGDQCITGACSGHVVPEPAELGPTVRLSWVAGETAVHWDDPPGPYHVYRGVNGGDVPWSYDHVCLVEGSSEPSAADPESPAAGTFFYYLVSRVAECRESVVGRDGTGTVVPTVDPCGG